MIKDAPSWLLWTQRVQGKIRGGSELHRDLRAGKFSKKDRVYFAVQIFLQTFILERAYMLPYSSNSVTMNLFRKKGEREEAMASETYNNSSGAMIRSSGRRICD